MANKFSAQLKKEGAKNKDLNLSSLIEDNGIDGILVKAKKDGRFLSLSPDHFTPDPNQPRKTFDEDSLEELKNSIESRGQLQAILVGTCGSDNKYPIIAGERRWRAISESKVVNEVIAVIKEDSTDEIGTLLIQIDENNKREEVPAIENAQAMQRVIDICKSQGHNQEHAAKILGVSKGRLSQSVSLLKAPQLVQSLSLHGETQDVDVLYHLAKASKEKPEEVSGLIEGWRSGQVVNMRKAARDLATTPKKGKQIEAVEAGEKPKKEKEKSPVSSVQAVLIDDKHKLIIGEGKKSTAFVFDEDSVSLLKAEIEKNWS